MLGTIVTAVLKLQSWQRMISWTGQRSGHWHNIGLLTTEINSSRLFSGYILKCVTRVASHWREWKTNKVNEVICGDTSTLWHFRSSPALVVVSVFYYLLEKGTKFFFPLSFLLWYKSFGLMTVVIWGHTNNWVFMLCLCQTSDPPSDPPVCGSAGDPNKVRS